PRGRVEVERDRRDAGGVELRAGRACAPDQGRGEQKCERQTGSHDRSPFRCLGTPRLTEPGAWAAPGRAWSASGSSRTARRFMTALLSGVARPYRRRGVGGPGRGDPGPGTDDQWGLWLRGTLNVAWQTPIWAWLQAAFACPFKPPQRCALSVLMHWPTEENGGFRTKLTGTVPQ